MIDLKNKQAVIIGGGKVASRRIAGLLDSEAVITVISPEATDDIKNLHNENMLTWKQKNFTSSDVQDAFLVIIATNEESVNQKVKNSVPANCLVNAAHHAGAGNLHFPARLKRGNLVIAVSTNGASPMLAKKIRKELSSQYDNRYEQYLDFLLEARTLLKTIKIDKLEKENYLRDFLTDSYLQPEKQEQTLFELSALKQDSFDEK